MPEVHARLSASGASRWINCPPSVRMEEAFPDKGSSYAAEGTLAHSVAELFLRYNNGELNKRTFNTRLNKLKKEELFSDEMEDYCADYAQSVWEQVNEAKALCSDPEVLFEQRLDFSDYVPGGFGTGDVVIVADEVLQVIDLKYGKGVGVSAENNPQLRLYGLGALTEYSVLYDIKEVKMTIIQPRLDNVSTEVLSVEELTTWAEDVVKPAADLAEAGEGDLCVGDHCRFCKARATCRARADYNLELTKLEFRNADVLEEWEIGEVLERADELSSWVRDITDYAFDQALNHGKHWDGWKLVEGRSVRKYVDEEGVSTALQAEGYAEEDLFNKKLKGITEMEKLVGKKLFAEALVDLVEKPAGKPVLVKETDKRPALNGTESAKNDFMEEK